jgi:hypothetical protein
MRPKNAKSRIDYPQSLCAQKSYGGAEASAASVFLDDVSHRLRRIALHPPLRRSERGLLYFCHGLLAQKGWFLRVTAIFLKSDAHRG